MYQSSMIYHVSSSADIANRNTAVNIFMAFSFVPGQGMDPRFCLQT